MVKLDGKGPLAELRLGIMGGTFDPIHYGHLVAAEMARSKFNLDKVLFIPTGKPPHKNRTDISEGAMRYEMIKRAIHDNPAFDISTLELERQGPSYTVDLSLIHISEPTRLGMISYAVFCFKKKK